MSVSVYCWKEKKTRWNTRQIHMCSRRGGRRREGRVVLGAKYKFTGREFWLLGTSTSALALRAAAKVSGGCQAELAAHLPVLLLHLQDLCPRAVNRSRVQLMIVSGRGRKRRGGTGLPSVTPPVPLVAHRPTTASSSAALPRPTHPLQALMFPRAADSIVTLLSLPSLSPCTRDTKPDRVPLPVISPNITRRTPGAFIAAVCVAPLLQSLNNGKLNEAGIFFFFFFLETRCWMLKAKNAWLLNWECFLCWMQRFLLRRREF